MRYLALLLLGVACSHSPGPEVLTTREQLFPEGKYIHDVTVIIKESGKEFSFKGYIKNESDNLKAVGVGFLSTTLFKMDYNKQNQLNHVEIFYPPLKKRQAEFEEYSVLLAKLFMLSQEQAFSKKLQFESHGDTTEVELSEWDSMQIPKKIKILSKAFQADVKVSPFEK